MISKLLRTVAAAALLALATACGGGGSPATTAGGSTGLGVGSGNPPVNPTPPAPEILRYEVGVVADGSGALHFVTLKGDSGPTMKRMKNPEDMSNIIGCAVPTDGTVFEDGTIPAWCQVVDAALVGTRTYFAVNPINGAMTVFKGTLPEKLKATIPENGIFTELGLWRWVLRGQPCAAFGFGTCLLATTSAGELVNPMGSIALYLVTPAGATLTVTAQEALNGDIKNVAVFKK